MFNNKQQKKQPSSRQKAFIPIRAELETIVERHNNCVSFVQEASMNPEMLSPAMIGISHLLGMNTSSLEKVSRIIMGEEEDETEGRIGFVTE